MTAEEWARHRLAAEIRRRRSSPHYYDRVLARYLVLPTYPGPWSPPPAGTWFRDSPTKRWHLFTGDLAWRPGWWAGPAMLAACGYRTSSRAEPPEVDGPPEDRCRNCQRRRLPA